jgi:hypothetical protein
MIRQKSNKLSSVNTTIYLLLPFAVLLFCAPPYHNGTGFNQTGTPRKGHGTDLTINTKASDSAARESCRTGSRAAESADSANSSAGLQAGEDSLYDNAVSDLEAFAWDSTKVNFKKLDSLNWTDTVRIVLADSSKNKLYCQPFCGPVTSDFGLRSWHWHYGTDVRLLTGDTVRSAFDGIVRLVTYDRHGYGQVIVIRHADGLETLYGHLSRNIAVPQQCVKAGEVIGLGGNTGHSTGSHLHFEMRYYGHAFDPCYIVDFDSCGLRLDTLILTKANFEYLIELRKEQWCTVCGGNTLGSIGRRYHTSIAKLCLLNHITRKTILRIGRKIRYQ